MSSDWYSRLSVSTYTVVFSASFALWMPAQRHGAQQMAWGQKQGKANGAYILKSGRIGGRIGGHGGGWLEHLRVRPCGSGPRVRATVVAYRRALRRRGAVDEPSQPRRRHFDHMPRREWLLHRTRPVGIADDPDAKDGLAARHQLPCASGRPLGRVTLYRHSKGKKSGKRERFTIKES